MTYHSTQSDDYLWYLILRGKQKEKNKNTPEYKVPPHFQWSEQKHAKTMEWETIIGKEITKR